jgi:hypothetical protein
MGLGGPQDPSRVLRGRGSSFSLGFASRFSDLFRAIWRRFSCLAATSVLETVALAAGLFEHPRRYIVSPGQFGDWNRPTSCQHHITLLATQDPMASLRGYQLQNGPSENGSRR